MRVGFIGLGVMGAPMARHVMSSGTVDAVGVHSRRRASAAAVEAAGAWWADNPRSLAAASDLVVYVVPTIADVIGTLDGPDGLLAGADHPLLLVVSSTTSAAEVRALDAEVRAASDNRVHVVDAPVSGGQEGAEAGTLSVMVGGPDADASRVVDVLSACGRAVHLGPLGAGQITKACNQLIVASAVVANAEAAVLAERSGIDVGAMFDLLIGGYAGSRVMEVKARRFAEHDHSPSGPAKFMIKDLRSYAESAAQEGITTYLVEPLRALYGGLTEAGLGDYDTAVVQRYVEDTSTTTAE